MILFHFKFCNQIERVEKVALLWSVPGNT